jgi:predicted methyltransferase
MAPRLVTDLDDRTRIRDPCDRTAGFSPPIADAQCGCQNDCRGVPSPPAAAPSQKGELRLRGVVAHYLSDAYGVRGGGSGLHLIKDALADKTRPRAHRSRDVRDKTAQVLALLDIQPGQRVVDLLPFRGYFARLFANLVGDPGRVFAAIPCDLTRIDRIAKGKLELEALAAIRPNVTVISGPAQAAGAPPRGVDLFWISQNYHDLEGSFMGPLDIGSFNAAVHQALSPGATYVVIDHSARADCPRDAARRLHRIVAGGIAVGAAGLGRARVGPLC